MRVISHTKLSPTLTITECPDGFWLWDETRGMNLSMKAKSSTEAFVEALTYYQHRLVEVETELRLLKKNVETFIATVTPEEHDE